MKQKTKKLIKQMSVMMLTIMMAVIVVSGFSDKGIVYAGTSFDSAEIKKDADECTYDKNSDDESYYKVVLETKSFLQFINSNSISTEKGDDIVISVYNGDKNEIKTFTQDDVVMQRTNTFAVTTDTLEAGTYYFSVARKPGLSGASAAKNSGKVKLTVTPSADNTDSSNAETIDMPVEGTIEKTWKDVLINSAHRKMYYTLNVTDKAYYSFKESSGTVVLYKGTTEEYANQIASASDLAHSEQLLEVGKYLAVGYGVTEGKEYNVKINCRDFLDIKKIDGQDYYEVNKDSKTLISLAYTPATGYESSVKWDSANSKAMEITGYDYNEKTTLEDKSKAYIYGRELGEYTATVTTSEGVTKTIKVMVKPNPAKAKEMTAFSTSKKKAKITLTWEGDTAAYAVYMKKGSDFVKVADVNSKSYTFNNLAPGKTYYFRVESLHKNGDAVVCKSMSEDMVGYTAPYTAPKIKSLKQKGKTGYTKPYTRNESYWSNHIYHHVIRHYGNTSNATVKMGIKKVKGASKYQLSTGSGDAGPLYTNGTVYLGYKGKIKAKNQKIRIRPVFIKGVCTSYGPWSKYKSVRIKGTK